MLSDAESQGEDLATKKEPNKPVVQLTKQAVLKRLETSFSKNKNYLDLVAVLSNTSKKPYEEYTRDIEILHKGISD